VEEAISSDQHRKNQKRRVEEGDLGKDATAQQLVVSGLDWRVAPNQASFFFELSFFGSIILGFSAMLPIMHWEGFNCCFKS
jgi:hypothetical protein